MLQFHETSGRGASTVLFMTGSQISQTLEPPLLHFTPAVEMQRPLWLPKSSVRWSTPS